MQKPSVFFTAQLHVLVMRNLTGLSKAAFVAFTIVTLCFSYSCSKKEDEQEQIIPDNTANVKPESASVLSFQVANLVVKGGFTSLYKGTFGGQPVDIRLSGDTTLSFLVPDVAEGKHVLEFELGRITYTVTKPQVTDPNKLITDMVANLDAQINKLPVTTTEQQDEVNDIKAYKQEVLKLYNSLTAEQKRQTAYFYEANKGVFRQFMSQVYTNLDGPTSLRQSECPRVDFKSFYSCTADNLATSAIALKNSSKEFLKLMALAGISAYLAPASFGLSAISTTLAVGMAGYLLITEIRPAALTFKHSLKAFLGANWIFTKALFSVIRTEFETGLNTDMQLDASFHSIMDNDRDVNSSTNNFISALRSLQLQWDLLTQVFGSTPTYKGSLEQVTLNTNDITISNISNPNVQLVTRSNENVTFKSLSGKEESFSFHIKASKEGFVTEKDITAKVIAITDSTSLYKNACVGTWTVQGFDPNNPTTTYTLELKADGSGSYRVPNNPNTYRVSWYISRSANNEYRLYESGFWHPAYDGLSRTRLTWPVSSFKTFANFDANFVSQIYNKN